MTSRQEIQDEFDELVDKYNSAMEPLECWLTSDLVRLHELIDAELQQRAFEAEFHSPFEAIEEEDEFDVYGPSYGGTDDDEQL